MRISPAIFFIFSKLWLFGFFRRGGVKGQEMTYHYQFQSVTLYISRTIDHIMKILGTQVQNNDISRYFSLFFLFFFIFVNIKIHFLLPHSNSYFNKYLFVKFINECQTEILGCVPPSHVCDFLIYFQLNIFEKILSLLLI